MDQFETTSANPNVDARRVLRRAFLLALIPAVVLAGKRAQSADDESWTIDIQPQHKLQLVALQADASAAPLGAPANDLFAPVAAAEPVPEAGEIAEPASEEHGVAIVPNGKFRMHGLTYRQVYDSIPFSRTEYLANPSYRHEATMELLTGTPRQTVIHRTYEPRLNEPIGPQPEFLYNRYGTYGGTFDGGHGGYGYGGFGFYRPQYAPAFRYFLPIGYGL